MKLCRPSPIASRWGSEMTVSSCWNARAASTPRSPGALGTSPTATSACTERRAVTRCLSRASQRGRAHWPAAGAASGSALGPHAAAAGDHPVRQVRASAVLGPAGDAEQAELQARSQSCELGGRFHVDMMCNALSAAVPEEAPRCPDL